MCGPGVDNYIHKIGQSLVYWAFLQNQDSQVPISRNIR